MKKAVLAALFAVLALSVIAWWLSDRPIDEIPNVPDGMGNIAFNPKFGPKTTQEVEDYVQRRAAKRFGRKLTVADRESHIGKAAWTEAVNTLKRRWGLTLAMSQDEIDAVRAQQEQVWSFMENTQTTRYKIRSFFGLNKQS
jgi:hypothetical protein